jgi:poly-gamma-glutamate capsule biosynthesis protein CapA/YwtB (metallophosphatase superfamily)
MDGSLDIVLAGDTMLGRGVNNVVRSKGPEYPLRSLRPVLRAADLFFLNLECAISPHDRRFSGAKKAFYFRADPIAIEVLTSAGVDLVTLANNHALDADHDGLRDTLTILDEHGIRCVGAGLDLDRAWRPAVIEFEGISIGVLAFCDHQRDFAAGADRPGIACLDVGDDAACRAFADRVADLRERVDHVFVSAHWQPNWAPCIGAAYRKLAKRLTEHGASVLWGHSPHHFQGVEWFGNGVVLYSTGDFVDDYAVDAAYRNDRQLLFRVRVDRVGVSSVAALPLELDYACTRPAGRATRRWIVERFAHACDETGSIISSRGEWIDIAPRPRDREEP